MTETGSDGSPERVTTTRMLPAPSETLFSRAANCTVGVALALSLSLIVQTPCPRAMVAPVGLERFRKKDSSGSVMVSPMTGTVT